MINNNNKLYLFFFLTTCTYLCLVVDNAHAHIPEDDKTVAPIQESEDQQNKIKIQFSYSPEKPLLYTPTDLIFSVQNLNKGDHIKDIITSITITKGNKIFFKFDEVAIQNGDLSLKVRFLEDGIYQVISKVSSIDNIAIALTSFNIIVPLQPFGKFNADSLTSLLIPAGLVTIALSALVIVLIMISRKNERAKKPSEEERQKEGSGEDK